MAPNLEQLPPHPGAQSATDTLRAGRRVFEAAGRADCHSGEALTDGKPYNLDTVSRRERVFETELARLGYRGQAGRVQMFSTPSLRGLAYSAPYLHDRSAQTLDAAIDAMPMDRPLSREERRQLIRYLRSL